MGWRASRATPLSLLAREGDLVASCLDLCLREIVVFQLQFLQAQLYRSLAEANQSSRWGRRTFSELTFQLAIFTCSIRPMVLLP